MDNFFAARYDEGGGKIGSFADRLHKIIKQLMEQGHPVEDLYQAFQLIHFLPDEISSSVLDLYHYITVFKFDTISKEQILEESCLQQLKKKMLHLI